MHRKQIDDSFYDHDQMISGILFLSCLSLVNFILHYNFWIVRNGDFTFGTDIPHKAIDLVT